MSNTGSLQRSNSQGKRLLENNKALLIFVLSFIVFIFLVISSSLPSLDIIKRRSRVFWPTSETPEENLEPIPFKSKTSSGLSESNLKILRSNSFIARGTKLARRVVIVTAATHHYLNFIRNLRCSVLTTTGQNVVLFALDKNISAEAKMLGIPTMDTFYERESVGADEGGQPFKFATNGFNVISKLKLLAFRDTLLSGIDLLFTDVDVVWCDHAPIRLVQQLEMENFADVLIQNGRPTDSFWPADANTGFFYAKSNRNTVDMFDYLGRLAVEPGARGDFDQSLFKKRICGTEGTGRALKNTDIGRMGHICRWEDRVVVDMLPLWTYPNGHSPLNKPFKKLASGELRKACANRQIVVFHNNWCSGNEKVKRMDAHALWSTNQTTGACRDLSSFR